MPAPASLVYETSITTGTGDFTLSNVTGWRSFSGAMSTGSTNTFRYAIRHTGAAEWETGIGYMSATSTLVRSVVIASSNADAAVNFSSGTKEVSLDMNADAFSTFAATDKVGIGLIGEVVASGTPASLSVNVHGLYRHLEFILHARGTQAASSVNARLRFNGDTGNNYSYRRDNTGGTTGALTSQAYIDIGTVAGASAGANYPSLITGNVGDYRGTTFYKQCRGEVGAIETTLLNEQWQGTYQSTSAITSVAVHLSAGNFANGSVLSVYGRA